MNRFTFFIFVSIAAFANYAFPLSIGDQAPAFTLTTTNGASVSLTQFPNQVCALYFFCGG